jgi:6-phosphogluconolactonase
MTDPRTSARRSLAGGRTRAILNRARSIRAEATIRIIMSPFSCRPVAVALCLLALTAAAAAQKPDATRVYFGTYASDTSRGIHLSSWDPATGKLGDPQLAGETKSPSFLALSPDRKHLVAVNESGTATQPDGAVTSWRIDTATGQLTQKSEQPTQGAAPCHVSISSDARTVIIANYGGGSFASYRLSEEGVLSPPVTFVQNEGQSVLARQSAPHAHSGTFSPNGAHAYFCDLGLDKILGRRVVAETSALEPLDVPDVTVKAGSGPRHFAFHPSLPVAYVINEISSTVTTLTYDAQTGALNAVQTVSTLPSGVTRNSTAHIAVHPDGKWVYGSNRGHDSVARFNVDPTTGWLRFVEATPSGGRTPRNFAIDPTGQWLLAAHQDSNSVVVQGIDQTTGALTATGTPISLGKPVCVVFY